MKVAQIRIDLAKDVFQVHGVSVEELVVVRKAQSLPNLLKYFANLDRI